LNSFFFDHPGVLSSTLPKTLRDGEICRLVFNSEKGLIKRKNLGIFIHNEATIHAVKLFTTPSTLHAAEVTPCEQDLKSSKPLEVRPNNIRFKVQVLEGDPAPHWKEVLMRSGIARWCHD